MTTMPDRMNDLWFEENLEPSNVALDEITKGTPKEESSQAALKK